MKTILFTLLFSALVFTNCDKKKRRALEEAYCDDYDGGKRVPSNEEFCYKLPLTNEDCEDGEKPYKCCYAEYTDKSGAKRKG